MKDSIVRSKHIVLGAAVLLLLSATSWVSAAVTEQNEPGQSTTMNKSASFQQEPALQQLIRQLQDPNETMRLRAAKELGKLGGSAREAIPALQNALNDPDEDVRIVAARSLKAIQTSGGAANEQVQRLVRELQSPDEIVRLRAAKELGKLGAAANAALPNLQQLLQDPDEDVRRVAANSIRLIQTTGPNEALQKLIQSLGSPDELVRLKAAKDLAKLGTAAKAALPALQKLLQDPDEDVRRVVANAINRIGGGSADPGTAVGVAGTVWEGNETLAGFGKLKFQLDAGGKAQMFDAKWEERGAVGGNWTQSGNQVKIQFKDCVYEGTIQGEVMAGNAHFFTGSTTWTFSVTRLASPAPTPDLAPLKQAAAPRVQPLRTYKLGMDAKGQGASLRKLEPWEIGLLHERRVRS